MNQKQLELGAEVVGTIIGKLIRVAVVVAVAALTLRWMGVIG